MGSEGLNTDGKLVAVCGKGGTGKTAVTSMMAKAIMESDKHLKLLLVDADPAMGLPYALGAKVTQTIGAIREEIINAARDGGADETAEVCNMLDYKVLNALKELEGYALLAMGRTETLGCFCPVNSLLRGAIQALSKGFELILIDGEAGLEQINRQIVNRVDTLIVVSDGTFRSLQTAVQIKKMAQDDHVIAYGTMGVVFNRVQGNEDILRKYAEERSLEVLGCIPQDEYVAHFDLLGKPLLDLPDASPAFAAVREITQRFILGGVKN